MDVQIRGVPVDEIHPLRELYRQEMNCQIVHDSLHRRGYNDSYLILADGRTAGYGTVTSGKDEHRVFPRGILNEFYLLPVHKGRATPIFRRLLVESRSVRITAQTNDALLSLMLRDFADEITVDAVLFHDAFTSCLPSPGGCFRRHADVDGKNSWVIEEDGTVLARGGFLTHYNPPYGDLHMEVADTHRRLGYGSYMVQELKRVCYEAGRKPAARCNPTNLASRRTLEKAGLLPCGHLLTGTVCLPGS